MTVYNDRMRYTVYVDVLFRNSLVMNYLTISLTGILLDRSATRKRRICAAGGCALAQTLLLFSGDILPGIVQELLCGIFLPLLLLRSTLGREEDARKGCIRILTLYIITFLLGGAITAIENLKPFRKRGITSGSLLMTGLLVYELTAWIHRCLERAGEKRRHLYRVSFLIDRVPQAKRICCEALMDSGNCLREPISARPVCILEKKLIEENQTDIPLEGICGAVPYKSIGCEHGLLFTVTLKDVWIAPKKQSKGENPVFRVDSMLAGLYGGILSGESSYQMLLQPEIFQAGQTLNSLQ